MNLWQEAVGASRPRGTWWSPPASGNRAFDEYRSDTLRRLEEEEKEFRQFLTRLRAAKDKAEFDQTARKLVRMFHDNFTRFEGHVDADVRAAAPEVRIAAE